MVEALPQATIDYMTAKIPMRRCGELELACILGTETPSASGGKPHNSALVIAETGRILGVHHKTKLTPLDAIAYTPSNSIETFELLGVKADLGLRAVARAEGLTCTDEDLDEEIEQIATAMRQKPQRVRDEFERGGQISAVRSDVEKQKALDWLLERVEIVDTEGQAIDRADLEPKEDEPAGDSASGSVDDDETESDPE